MNTTEALRQCIEAMKLVDFKDCAESEELWHKFNLAQANAERVLRDGEKQDPVAYLKEWSSVGNAKIDCRRVDLKPDCELWLLQMFPKITPLYTHPAPSLQAVGAVPEEIRPERMQRQGLHIAIEAQAYGWDVNGDEGAFEFITRKAYQTGWDDRKDRTITVPEDSECHRILKSMAEQVDEWAEGLNYEPSQEELSKWCMGFIVHELGTAPQPAAAPSGDVEREKLSAALQKLILAADNIDMPEGGLAGWVELQMASEEASAVLASVGVKP